MKVTSKRIPIYLGSIISNVTQTTKVSNMDTQNNGLEKVSHFKHGPLGYIYMINFSGVKVINISSTNSFTPGIIAWAKRGSPHGELACDGIDL